MKGHAGADFYWKGQLGVGDGQLRSKEREVSLTRIGSRKLTTPEETKVYLIRHALLLPILWPPLAPWPSWTSDGDDRHHLPHTVFVGSLPSRFSLLNADYGPVAYYY